MKQPADVLSVNEAARELNVSAQTIRNMVDRGALPAMRTAGGTRIFQRADVERFRDHRRAPLDDEPACHAPATIDATDADGLPLVLFDADLVRLLKTSARTLKRWRRIKQFPIPEILPKLDRRHRYARADVLAYITRSSASARGRAGL